MKKLVLSFLLAAGFLCASPITTSVKLVNAGSPALKDSQGYYVGPYTLLINGQNVAALCIDFEDRTSTGTTWNAYLSQVGGDISKTYHPTYATQYKEEAYLFNLILQPGADRIDIQHAAWAITDSNYHANSAAQTYINLAVANYATFDFSGYEIVSGINAQNHQQEFLIRTPTPEPASFALIGVGLLAAGVWRRKKSRNLSAAN